MEAPSQTENTDQETTFNRASDDGGEDSKAATRWTWPKWTTLVVLAASIYFFLVFPAIEGFELHNSSLALSAMTGVAFGLLAFAAIFFGLSGATWVEGYLIGVVAVSFVWSCGILGTHVADMQIGDATWPTLLIAPGILLSACCPLLFRRHFSGWRISRVGHESPTYPSSLGSIFVSTLVIACVLLFLRAPQVAWGAQAMNYWGPLLLISVLISVVSAVVVFPAAKTMNANSAARQLAMLFALAVVAAVVVCGVIAATVTTGVGGPPLEFYANIPPCVLFAAFTIFAAFRAIHRDGFRLQTKSAGTSRMATPEEVKGFRIRTRLCVAAMLVGVVGVNMVVSSIIGGRQKMLVLANDLRLLTQGDQFWYLRPQGQYNYISQEHHPDSKIVGVAAMNADDATTRDIVDHLQQANLLTEFTRLRLHGTELTDSCFQDIARLQALTHLGLGDGRITGQNFASLKRHPLIRLELKRLDLREVDWSVLEPSLQSLTIEDCKVAPERLGQFLKRLPKLREVRLVNLEMSSPIDTVIETLNQPLPRMAIGGEPVTNEVVQRLEKTLGATELGFPNANIDDEAIDSILQIQQFAGLDLSNTKVTDQGVAKLGERVAQTNYFRLNLSGTKINGSAFKDWKSNPVWLDLSNTNVDDRLGKSLAASGKKQGRVMNQLNLSSTKITDAILLQLAVSPSIHELNISNTAITAAGLLRSGVSGVVQHVVISPGQFTDDEIQQLQNKRIYVVEKSFQDPDPWDG